MEERKSNGAVGGIGLSNLLTIVFVVLKLCKVINWSWVWVLAPTWISIIIFIISMVICIIAFVNE